MKKYFINLIIVVLIVSIGIPYALAVDNTFETRLTIGPEDTADPTIPSGLTATTVSSSQINLAWNASTDDIGVAGYRVYRDTLVIASTTSLFYQDTGLTASTTYSYNVEAYDSIPKYSGQSATVSATTSEAVVPTVSPTPTPTPTDDGGNGSGSMAFNISNLNVVPSQNSSVINFSTNQPTQAKVFWGLTEEYELGSISGLLFGFSHSILVDSLQPSTRYFFRIEVTNGFGKVKHLESSFQTKASFTESLLTNVTNFKATPKDESITLSWKNPKKDVFDSVRLVRSDKFFPRDILDGEIIYEGSGEKYKDEDVERGVTYYYTIFTKDEEGNYSSGALSKARIPEEGEITPAGAPTDPFAEIPILEDVNPVISSLTLSDFDFIQDGEKIMPIGSTINIDNAKNLTISLDYDKVPEILKTIAITLSDPKDDTKVFPFLLRVNKEKTKYEATVAPLGKSGEYGVNIVILDYKNQGLKRIEGSLLSLALAGAENLFSQTKKFDGEKSLILISILLLILFIFFLLTLFGRRSKRDNRPVSI